MMLTRWGRARLVAVCSAGVLASVSLQANLGEPLAAAKGRAGDYQRRYGAVDPIFKTGERGEVVMECWAAPPAMWPKARADAFANELLPAKLRGRKPKVLAKDGSLEGFAYDDGTQVVFKAFQGGLYIQVEVRAAGFNGSSC
jgi:hypothetical protein